jgi:hypothetical protein
MTPQTVAKEKDDDDDVDVFNEAIGNGLNKVASFFKSQSARYWESKPIPVATNDEDERDAAEALNITPEARREAERAMTASPRSSFNGRYRDG